MRKVTSRTFNDVESGNDIEIKFTRIQGTRRSGESVTHETEVENVERKSNRKIYYENDGDDYIFELSTGYIRDGEEVLGRDATAKIE